MHVNRAMGKKLGQWLRDHKWLLIGLMWIAAFCLGYIGFSNYYASIGDTRSPSHICYVTMQLFVLESGPVPGPVGWELQVARFLAPLVAVYTAIQAVAIILREQLLLFRLRFLRGHIVICGLGRKGLLLCRAFRQSGERVVVIEHNKDNELISQCREYGAAVLIDNAASPSVLRRAGVDKAKYIISVCGDDGTNAEIAVHSRELVRERKGKVLFIDASKDYLEGKAQNFLRQEDIEKTSYAFDSFETVERYCTVAWFEDIKGNDYNLNISRYVDTTEPEEPVDIREVMKNLNTLQVERTNVQNRLVGFLKELGY